MEYENSITHHAEQRLKERLRLTHAQVIHFATNGWKNGLSSENFTRQQQKNLLKSYDDSTQKIVKLFQNTLLIFSRTGILITAYPIPTRKQHFDKNHRKILNFKKYNDKYFSLDED